jgi:hypothetical protein
MNPLVAEYIGLLPVSPIDYVWFDTTSGSELMNSYSEFINKYRHSYPNDISFAVEDLPMPFEKIGLMLSITSNPNPSQGDIGMMPILFERRGSNLFMKQYIKGLREPSIEVLFPEAVLHTMPNGESGIKCSMRFHPKYLRAIGKTKADEHEEKMEMEFCQSAIKKLTLLCYGIPNQGAKPSGFELSCSPREEQRNIKKRLKGKCQLFEWKTVEIKATIQMKYADRLGGTHASPKPHDRRGHLRRYKNGKVVYIRSCTINRHKIKTEGFIHHDYKVTA